MIKTLSFVFSLLLHYVLFLVAKSHFSLSIVISFRSSVLGKFYPAEIPHIISFQYKIYIIFVMWAAIVFGSLWQIVKICNANFVFFITAVKRTWNIVRVVSTFARASGFSLRQCREKHPAIRFFELGINPGDRISISFKPCAIESRNSFVNSAQK